MTSQRGIILAVIHFIVISSFVFLIDIAVLDEEELMPVEATSGIIEDVSFGMTFLSISEALPGIKETLITIFFFVLILLVVVFTSISVVEMLSIESSNSKQPKKVIPKRVSESLGRQMKNLHDAVANQLTSDLSEVILRLKEKIADLEVYIDNNSASSLRRYTLVQLVEQYLPNLLNAYIAIPREYRGDTSQESVNNGLRAYEALVLRLSDIETEVDGFIEIMATEQLNKFNVENRFIEEKFNQTISDDWLVNVPTQQRVR
jgi:hypothetical protein